MIIQRICFLWVLYLLSAQKMIAVSIINYNHYHSIIYTDTLIKKKSKVLVNDSLTLTTIKDTLRGFRKSKTENIKQQQANLLKTSQSKFDSTHRHSFLKKQLAALKPQGSVSLGYEYGVLPFVSGDNYPSGGYKTEGRLSCLLLNLPFEVTYSYTNIKNVIGLTNFFRINFDAERYKEQLNQKLSIKDQLSKNQLDKLQQQQQQLLQKIAYLNFMNQSLTDKLPNTDSLKNKYTPNYTNGIPNLPDSFPQLSVLQMPNIAQIQIPTIPNTDSLKITYDYSQKKERITSELEAYTAEYKTLTDEINDLKKELDKINQLQTNPAALANPYLSKTQQILSHIKKFEIGLCHPTYSTFLVNNIPLQGVNVEYAQANRFFAFTYGTTINNLMYNTNTLQGKLQGARNLYNYFDFGNVSAGRKILSVKGGWGLKETSHLHIGFLLGKGRTDYLQSLNEYAPSPTQESNLVVEIDGKYKISEQVSVDIVAGKSLVKEEDIAFEQLQTSINDLFSNYRSYALLGRINLGIKKTNTKLTVTTRWVDPYFKSFGIGFLRFDNLRYEFKAEQSLGKKLKYTLQYRREEDNLLRLIDYKNTFQSINNSLQLKLSRQFTIRVIYAPLLRELKNTNGISSDRNNISTVLLAYTPKTKKVSIQCNALYSKYNISGDSAAIHFENVTYTHQVQFKSGFRTGGTVSWFKNSLKDTLNNDTYLGVVDIGYTTSSNSRFSIGGKVAVAYKQGLAMQYGFLAKVVVNVYKNLFWEAEIEKIIIGDYYNSFILSKIQQFPYYSNTKLVLNF